MQLDDHRRVFCLSLPNSTVRSASGRLKAGHPGTDMDT